MKQEYAIDSWSLSIPFSLMSRERERGGGQTLAFISRFLFGISQKIHLWHTRTHTFDMKSSVCKPKSEGSYRVSSRSIVCMCIHSHDFFFFFIFSFFHVCLPLWFIAAKNLILSLFWDRICAIWKNAKNAGAIKNKSKSKREQSVWQGCEDGRKALLKGVRLYKITHMILPSLILLLLLIRELWNPMLKWKKKHERTNDPKKTTPTLKYLKYYKLECTRCKQTPKFSVFIFSPHLLVVFYLKMLRACEFSF